MMNGHIYHPRVYGRKIIKGEKIIYEKRWRIINN